eukprot:Skav229279  [mRNA]  locus=scaffold952:353825:355006:- [translate_table: standard]
MPLNATWTFTAFVSGGTLPAAICTMFGVTTISVMVTMAAMVRWSIQDCMKAGAIVSSEKRPIVPIHLELVRFIITTPAIISSLTVVCMLRPSTAFVLELLMAIFSCVVVGNMTRYFLALLGEPPLPQQLLARVPKRRWWCGRFCGGVNDTLPGMGHFWSPKPHRVAVEDIHRGTSMVRIFMFVFITINCFNLSFSMVPINFGVKPGSPWCISKTAIPPWVSGFTVFLTVWASFVGMAGFSVISGSIGSVLDIEVAMMEGTEQKLVKSFKVGAQSKTIAIYMLLPLLLPILSAMPVRFEEPKIPLTHRDPTGATATIFCPVFDQEVCGHVMYSMCVAIGMMVVSILNYRSFQPADMSVDRLPEILAQLNPPSPADCEDCDETEDESQGSSVDTE